MNNLQSPAYPTKMYNSEGGNAGYAGGFTKLEKAALMIAQGYIASRCFRDYDDEVMLIAAASNSVARAVLEEANK